MKVVLTAINAKYIHSNLAVYCLRAYAKPYKEEIEIAETLLAGRTVLINMEGLNIEIAQRIIDFTSGATYAMHGSLQKVSNYIFLATPNGVDISGDIQNLMDAFGAGSSFTY